MKKAKAFLATALIGMSVGAYAQGTVFFDNASITPRVYTNDLAGHSGLAKGQSFTVALYWASASGEALVPVFTGQGTAAPDGVFFVSSAIFTGTAPGEVGVFQVYGWTGNATSLSQAMASGALFDQSAPFLNATGGAGTPPGVPPHLTGWTGNLILSPAPEPTTIALGGLGAAALLLFRRRK